MGPRHQVSGPTRARQQRGWPQHQLPCPPLPGEPGALEQGPKIHTCRRDPPVWVCRGDAHPPCSQGCQIWAAHQCNLYFLGPACRVSQPAVLGMSDGACTFPLGKALRAASGQTARCDSRSCRTAQGPCKDPARQRAGTGREKAVVTTQIPTRTCRPTEVALTRP